MKIERRLKRELSPRSPPWRCPASSSGPPWPLPFAAAAASSFDFASALTVSKLGPQVRGLGGGLLLEVPSAAPWPRPSWRRRAPVGETRARRRRGSLSPLQLAQRHRQQKPSRASLSLRLSLRLVGPSWRPRPPRGGSASALAGAAAMASRFGPRTAPDGENATGAASFGEMITRIPNPRRVEQLLRKAVGHPHAAV